MSAKTLFHAPVLSLEILQYLVTEDIKTVFDGTLGLGGHAEMILEQRTGIENYYAAELDNEHLEYSKKRLRKFSRKFQVWNNNFSEMPHCVKKEINRPLAILLDLGLCSNQIDSTSKGFSFKTESELKMTFDSSQTKNAKTFLNEATEKEIAEVIKNYGEERQYRKIARNIVNFREKESLETTGQLREIITASVSGKELGKTLMKVFQALRIEANDEINHLQQALRNFTNFMKQNDVLGIISYHSLEDREVKQFFREISNPITEKTEFSNHTVISEALFQLITKKPLKPSAKELTENPRSRSARLRIIKKIKN